MNIIMRNDYRAEVVLSEEELCEFDISYDELDYGNIETRRVLWTLLDYINLNCGAAINPAGKLLIEVRREAGGKCRICFTSLPPRAQDGASVKQLVKTEDTPLIFECGGVDAAVAAAGGCGFSGKSSLYEREGRYRIIFFADGEEKKKIRNRLTEFGEVLPDSRITAAVCLESWRGIEAENAVEKLKTLA